MTICNYSIAILCCHCTTTFQTLSSLCPVIFQVMFSIIGMNFFKLEPAQSGYLMAFFGIAQMVRAKLFFYLNDPLIFENDDVVGEYNKKTCFSSQTEAAVRLDSGTELSASGHSGLCDWPGNEQIPTRLAASVLHRSLC